MIHRGDGWAAVSASSAASSSLIALDIVSHCLLCSLVSSDNV